MSTKKVHIMDSVDILDRLDILLFQPVPGHFTIDIVCKEKGRVFVMDNEMLASMQNKVTELCQTRNLKVSSGEIEKTRGFIQEYVGRFIQKCHKLNLALIEDVAQATDDHYKHLRNLPKALN